MGFTDSLIHIYRDDDPIIFVQHTDADVNGLSAASRNSEMELPVGRQRDD